MILKLSDKIKGYLVQNEGLGFLQVYNLLKTAALVVISIIFAKWIKDITIINNWETYMLLGSGFTFFYVSGFGYTLVSFVKRYEPSHWVQIFQQTLLLLFLLSLISSVFIVIVGHYYTPIAFPIKELFIFCLYLIGITCSTVLEYFYFLNKQFKKLMIWGFFGLTAFILAVVVPLLIGYEFIYTLYALVLVGIGKFLFSLYVLNYRLTFKNTQFIKPLLRFNWPIITSLLFGTGYIYWANFIVKAQVSAPDFNVFRFGSKEFPLFMVMANSFSIVLSAITIEKFNQAGFWSDIKKSHLRLMHQLLPMVCLLMLGSSFLFKLVFSNAFEQSAVIFNILSLTILIRLLFPQALLMGRGLTTYAFYSAVIECVIGLILVFILTPIYGIIGAATGLTLAYLSEKMVLILFCYRQNIDFHKSVNWYWFTFYLSLIILSFILGLKMVG